MKRILLFILVFGLNKLIFSQSPIIHQAYAFSRSIVRGTMPADSNEIKNDIEYFFYLDLPKKTKFSVNYAWVNKKIYAVTFSRLNTSLVTIVSDVTKKKNYKIKAKKNNELWLLETNLSEDKKTVPAKYKNLKAGTVLLQLSYKNKISYYVIFPIIHIKSDLRSIL